jgi:hypothetical protein
MRERLRQRRNMGIVWFQEVLPYCDAYAYRRFTMLEGRRQQQDPNSGEQESCFDSTKPD